MALELKLEWEDFVKLAMRELKRAMPQVEPVNIKLMKTQTYEADHQLYEYPEYVLIDCGGRDES